MKTQAEKVAATERALLALANDVIEFKEAAERVIIQICALAARHGVSIELPCPRSLRG